MLTRGGPAFRAGVRRTGMSEERKFVVASGEARQQPADNANRTAQSGKRDAEAPCEEVPIRVLGYSANCDAGGEHWQREVFQEDSRTTQLLPRGAVIPLKAVVSCGQNLMVINRRTDRYAHCRVSKLRTAAEINYVEIEFTHSIPDFWGNSAAKDPAAVAKEIAAFAAQMAEVPFAAQPAESREAAPAMALAVAACAAPSAGGAPAPSGSLESAVTVIRKRPEPLKETDEPRSGPEFFTPQPMELVAVGEIVEPPTEKRVQAAAIPTPVEAAPLAAPPSRKRSGRRTAFAAMAVCAVVAGYYLFSPAEVALPAPVRSVEARNNQASPVLYATSEAADPATAGDGTEPAGNVEVNDSAPEIEPQIAANQRVVLVSKMIVPDTNLAIHAKAAPELPMSAGAALPSVANKAEALLGPVNPAPQPPPPEVLPAKPEETAEVMTPARLLSSAQPVYPRMARQMEIEGDVALRITISPSGSVSAVKVLSGPQQLRAAAASAVAQWKYEPARLRGQPAESMGTVVLRFRLR